MLRVLIQSKGSSEAKDVKERDIGNLLAKAFDKGASVVFVLSGGEVYSCKYDHDNCCISKTLIHDPSPQIVSKLLQQPLLF